MEFVFWLSIAAVGYAYAGYPFVLLLVSQFRVLAVGAAGSRGELPTISLILPAHNEAAVLERKLKNCLELDYPFDRLTFIVVSDGSTDDTAAIARRLASDRQLEVYELPTRQGKAAALNAGLEHARGEIVVFSDASILLEHDALRRIVAPFRDPHVGCVSGEDHIGEKGGEGLYGRYELLLRNLESRVGSIVGASGSFYAQRRAVCARFVEGMAPDFLSVLHCVGQGYRAISESTARGSMTSVSRTQDEFRRKVRTLIRGMTALFAHARLLDPFRFGFFAYALWSHKIMRWLVPVFLLVALVANATLIGTPFYAATFTLQFAFYATAGIALVVPAVGRSLPGRIAAYFTVVNAAIAAAWFKYLMGARMEVWAPTKREM
jgi:cellulose synthase/poly-beta-1,6-N-acetylglucosamine synthase-like glycosyltransferase